MPGYVKQLQNVGYAENVREIVFQCVGDSANGSIPNTEMDKPSYEIAQGWFLDSVETVPGSPAPTADSDVVVNDEHGLDLLNGNGTDLLNDTAVKAVVPSIGGQNKRVPVRGKLTIGVSGQSVNLAQYKIILVLVKEV
jgi:hypothetical protein